MNARANIQMQLPAVFSNEHRRTALIRVKFRSFLSKTMTTERIFQIKPVHEADVPAINNDQN